MSKLDQIKALPRRGSLQSVETPRPKPVKAESLPPLDVGKPTDWCPICAARRAAKTKAQAKWRKKKAATDGLSCREKD